MAATVSADRVAEVFEVTVRRIYQLAQIGMPKETRGEYDLGKCMVWYIKFLRKELERRGPRGTEGSAGLQAETLKLRAAQAEKVATENAVRRGELLTIEAVRMVWTARVANTQKRLRAIPASLGPQLTNKSDPAYIADRLKSDIDNALNELAGGPAASPGAWGTGLEGTGSAA